MTRRTTIALLAACAPAMTLVAEVRLDIGANARRNDTRAPGWIEWPVDAGVTSATTQPEGAGAALAVTVRSIGVEALDSRLSKPELAVDTRVACDGIHVPGGGAIELVLSGLAPGRHAATTFHNSLWPGKAVDPIRIGIVGGASSTTGELPVDVRHDDDIAAAHVAFDVPAGGGDVVLRLDSPGGGEVVLNGLAIDGADPRGQARRPSPADRDDHADGDAGRVALAWTPAKGATSHRVYLARSATADLAQAALSVAEPPASLLIGRTDGATIDADVVDRDSLSFYAWRVDAIGADGVAVPGRVWTFRARHLAFPGAEGYGRFARGGRGGKVYRVTTLADAGPGSLRDAVEASAPRTVVFDVGGLITLQSRLIIRNPFITIAGETAPGKGVCVRNYSFGGLGARDLIMRHVRIRLGDLAGKSMDGTGLASCDHCIFDHLSISWTLDEAISTRGAKNVTIQRTLVSEALLNPPKYSGGYAGSIGGDVASLHHNLLAHNAGRNWSMAGALDRAGRHTGRLDLRNNVIYNWFKRTCDGGAMQVNLVNNYYKPGPASVVFHVMMPERNHVFGPQDYYVSGNVMEGRYGPDGDPWAGVVKPQDEELSSFIHPAPRFEPFVKTHTAAEAFENVLADVGCNVPTLDDHDARMIRETRDGTTSSVGSLTKTPGVINTQADVGGWEDYPEVHRPADWDVDGDGVPDAWERANGLDPTNPADGALDPDGDGYTALEAYLHSLTTRSK